jgi:aquaporin Z
MSPTEDREKPPSLGQKLLAEFAGTFFLVFVAAGADVVDAFYGGTIGHLARYLAPGFLVVAMIYSISSVSGAHINPAVTLAFVLRRVFPISTAVLFWIVQFAGALAAAAVLKLFFGQLVAHGASKPGPFISSVQAVSWEVLLTLLLVFVILSTAEEKAKVGKSAALAVGFTVALDGLFSSPVSGASMNPARSIGPQLVSGHVADMWIYIAGPCAGAALAVLLTFGIFGHAHHEAKEAAEGDRGE